jgi:hypothetical protein
LHSIGLANSTSLRLKTTGNHVAYIKAELYAAGPCLLEYG